MDGLHTVLKGLHEYSKGKEERSLGHPEASVDCGVRDRAYGCRRRCCAELEATRVICRIG